MSSLPVYIEEYPLHTEVYWLVHAVLTKRGQGQKEQHHPTEVGCLITTYQTIMLALQFGLFRVYSNADLQGESLVWRVGGVQVFLGADTVPQEMSLDVN